MVVASMPRQAPHGSDELAAADDAPRSEHNGTVPVLHATNPEMPFWGKGDWNSFFLLSFDNLSAPVWKSSSASGASRRWCGGYDSAVCENFAEKRREIWFYTWAERARGNVGWRFAICYGVFAGLLVAAHAGQKAGLVEPPVEEATHQQELEASVAEFEESLSKDSRVSVKKDDGEA